MRRAPSRQISSIPKAGSSLAAFSATTFNIGVPSFRRRSTAGTRRNSFNEEGTPRPRSDGRSTSFGYNSPPSNPQRYFRSSLPAVDPQRNSTYTEWSRHRLHALKPGHSLAFRTPLSTKVRCVSGQRAIASDDARRRRECGAGHPEQKARGNQQRRG